MPSSSQISLELLSARKAELESFEKAVPVLVSRLTAANVRDRELKLALYSLLALRCTQEIVSEFTSLSELTEAIVDAAESSIMLAQVGLDNSVHVLCRQILEVTMKVLYFHYHPRELNLVRKRLDVREFTPSVIADFIKKDLLLDRNEEDVSVLFESYSDLYAIFSRHVHVHNEEFSSFGLLSIQRSKGDIDGLLAKIRRTLEVSMAITIIYLPEAFRTLKRSERQAISKSFISATPRSVIKKVFSS